MFRIFRFAFEFPPEMPEFLKFGNRVLDYLEEKQQTEVDALTAQLKASNDRLETKLQKGAK